MNRSDAGKLGAIKSTEFWRKKKQRNIEIYDAHPKLCKACKVPIPYKKRQNDFCTRTCSATFNNAGVIRNYTDGKRCTKKCANCGTATINVKFCSQKCSGEFRRSTVLRLWLNSTYTVGCKLPLEARKYIYNRQGGKCAICGLSSWLGKPMPLLLDHIDGHSENSYENNVRLICGNCDMQLPTYKARNMGNGRHSRRERYKQGKSY